MAQEIDSSPLRPNSGASFQTHFLRQKSVTELAFVPGVMSNVFSAIFFFLGVGGVVFSLFGFLALGEPKMLFMGLGSIVFVLIGVWLNRVYFAPRTFNLVSQKVTIPVSKFSLQPNMTFVMFEDIKALQIVQKWVRSEKNRYWAYELNIVRNSGARLMLLEHADGEALLQDAKRISGMLGCSIVVDADLGHAKHLQQTQE